MWRFVLRENIRRYRELLADTKSEPERARLQRLLDQAEAELAELEALSTPEPVRQNGELRQIAEQAVNDAMHLLRAQSADLQLFRAETGSLMIVAQRNLPSPFLHHLENVRIGDGSAYARCFETNSTIAVEDLQADPLSAPHLDAARAAGIRSLLSVPLCDSSANPIGVLSVHFVSPHCMSEHDLARAKYLVRGIGLAVADVAYSAGFRGNPGSSGGV